MTDKNILVIEDNEANIELVTDLLEVMGHTVYQARTAEDGIRMAKAEPPHLILMDIGLPDMDGLEATRILNGDSATRDVPIIALTAHAMKGDVENIKAAGCLTCITKPIDTRAFKKEITRFLDAAADA